MPAPTRAATPSSRALKRSAGKRQTATAPRLPALDALLDPLRNVDSAAVGGIVHIEDDEGKPVARAEHRHDVRGTFCANLILSGLTDDQVADRMARSPPALPRSAEPTLTTPAWLWQSANRCGTPL